LKAVPCGTEDRGVSC